MYIYAKTLIPKLKNSCYCVAVNKQKVKAEQVRVIKNTSLFVAQNSTN
jgi:hypothetical protein